MTARDRLERCKNLLEQVVSELEDNSSTSPATPRSTNSAISCSASLSVEPSPSTSTSASSTKTVSIHEEHRRLFGFNSRGRRYSPFSQAGSGGFRNRASTNRLFKKPTWTRNFVCLASSEAVCPPNSTQYQDLRKAGLGEQKITLNITDGPLELDLKLKEKFPKLEKSGGGVFFDANSTAGIESAGFVKWTIQRGTSQNGNRAREDLHKAVAMRSFPGCRGKWKQCCK